MDISKALPTKFAQALCSKVALYGLDITKTGGDHDERDIELHTALAEFQQMIIGGAGFDAALCAYYSIELSTEQQDILKIVETSTKPWLIGHATGILLERLNLVTDRNFVQSAELLIRELINKQSDEKTNEDVESLVINVMRAK